PSHYLHTKYIQRLVPAPTLTQSITHLAYLSFFFICVLRTTRRVGDAVARRDGMAEAEMSGVGAIQQRAGRNMEGGAKRSRAEREEDHKPLAHLGVAVRQQREQRRQRAGGEQVLRGAARAGGEGRWRGARGRATRSSSANTRSARRTPPPPRPAAPARVRGEWAAVGGQHASSLATHRARTPPPRAAPAPRAASKASHAANVFRVVIAATLAIVFCSLIKYVWICDYATGCRKLLSNQHTGQKISSELPHLKKNTNVIGLILARGGSKGIKKKNLAKLGFSSVWISTDAADIAAEAEMHGAQVHWRSKESATDTAPSILGVQDFLYKHPEADIIGLVQCTSPFLTTTFLSDGLNLMLKGKYDSAFAVTRKHELRWRVNEDGTAAAINFSPYKRPRRQDWAGELVENGMFYFSNTKLINDGLLQGNKFRTGRIQGDI
ncbi:Protein of unknown function, partial [Gryllus bimaculatus]